MKRDALLAVGVALVLMLLYIWFRFKDLRFGASSVICLAHDVLVVLAFYAVARVSVGSTFIACMLTIVGSSINATIVIFDRVRESLRSRRRGQELAALVNESITDTLSRSIFTSLTTFFMVLALFIFGVASVKEFALPIMIGIICGAYSSICLAGSIWYVMRKKADDAARAGIDSKKSGKGTDSDKGSGSKSGKKKNDYSNLSKKERKERRRKEEEAKNKAKITV
jgi:SecD/SecF fusion protein